MFDLGVFLIISPSESLDNMELLEIASRKSPDRGLFSYPEILGFIEVQIPGFCNWYFVLGLYGNTNHVQS